MHIMHNMQIMYIMLIMQITLIMLIMQIMQWSAHSPSRNFQGWRQVRIVARHRCRPAPHAALSSLARCRGRRRLFLSGLLGSGGSAKARWKAALLSLRVSEEALQGLDALLAPLGFLVGERNRRTVQVLGLHRRFVGLLPKLVQLLGWTGDVEEEDACRPEAIPVSHLPLVRHLTTCRRRRSYLPAQKELRRPHRLQVRLER